MIASLTRKLYFCYRWGLSSSVVSEVWFGNSVIRKHSVGNAICASQSQAGFPSQFNTTPATVRYHNNRGDHRPQWTLATLVPGPGIHWPMGGYLSAEMIGLTVRYLFSHGPLCFRLFYTFPNTCFLLEIESLDGCESRRRLNQDHIRLYSPWYLPKSAPQGLTGHRTGAGAGGRGGNNYNLQNIE